MRKDDIAGERGFEFLKGGSSSRVEVQLLSNRRVFDKVNKRPYDLGELVNKPAVKVGKAYKSLDILNSLEVLLVVYGFYLIGVHLKAVAG
jgi:hypothetical protein